MVSEPIQLPRKEECQTMGSLIAYMFFLREDLRKELNSSVVKLIWFCSQYNVRFKNVNSEMYFIAELAHFRYYSTEDFENLCIQCFNFSEIRQMEVEFDMNNFRPLNRIPMIHPNRSGRMTNIKEYFAYKKKKQKAKELFSKK